MVQAHQARAKATSKRIPTVNSVSGDIILVPEGINYAFAAFYSDLYTSSSPPAARDASRYTILQIDKESMRGLGGPITVVEVQDAIKSLSVGKSPGLGGFLAEYYNSDSKSFGTNFENHVQ